jgi:hypothetical protein
MSLRSTLRAALSHVPAPVNQALKLSAPPLAVVFRFGSDAPPVLDELAEAMTDDGDPTSGRFRRALTERALFVTPDNDLLGSFCIQPDDEDQIATCFVFPLIEEDGRWKRSVDAPARGVAVTLTEMWDPPPARYGRGDVELLMRMVAVLEPIVTEHGGSVRVNAVPMHDVPAARARVREILEGWIDERR